MHWRTHTILVLVVSLISTKLLGQITVELKLPQEQFLPAEDIWLSVRIYNRSGSTIELGTDQEWLKVSVESRDGYIVEKLDEIPVSGAFKLENAQVATKRINLRPYFKLVRPGRYLVTATVRIKEWGEEYTASPIWFDIIEGRKIWEQEFGVPTFDTNAPPEMRKYALQQANYLKQLKLYFRLESWDGTHVYRVFPLGPLVSFGNPQVQIDKWARLHVLFQTSSRTFSYCVLNHEGDLVRRETYEYGDVRPRLRVEPNGGVVVVGGIRRFAPDDIPPREVIEAMSSTNSPLSTN